MGASSSDESEEDADGWDTEGGFSYGSGEEDVDWEDVSDEPDDSDEDEENVGEDGMERLMKALGDDGLDEFAQEQLRALEGSSDGNEDEGGGDGARAPPCS